MNEIWKIIPGYNNYECSNLGETRRVGSRRVECGHTVGRSTIYHDLVDNNGRRRNITTDNLICTTFHGCKPSTFHRVEHINGDIMDKSVENLRWCDRTNELNKHKIFKINSEGTIVDSYMTIKEAAEEEGIDPSSMSNRIAKHSIIDGYMFRKSKINIHNY